MDDIQNLNRSLVIRHLWRKGLCSRVQLSKELGLTPATITKIIRDLSSVHLVEEVGTLSGRRGRRQVFLKLNTANCHVIGVSLTRNHISSAVYDLGLQKYKSVCSPIEHTCSAGQITECIQRQIHLLLASSNHVKAIGITVPGPYFHEKDRIELIVDPGKWKQMNLKSDIGASFHIPVRVEHDSTAGALAFYWSQGIKQNQEVVVLISVGTGIGAGVCINGIPYSGSQGIASELGHISIDYNGPLCECGNYGCLEKYCSMPAFLAKTKRLLLHHPDSLLSHAEELSAVKIFEAANLGDPFAVDMVDDLASYLARGIITAVLAYNPNIIVLTGPVSYGGELLLTRIKSTLQKQLLPFLYQNLSITLDSPDRRIKELGSAMIAVNEILDEPTKLLLNQQKEGIHGKHTCFTNEKYL